MLKMGVPVATPVEFRDLSEGLKALCFTNGVLESFSQQALMFTGAARVYAVNSGRAALCIALKALAKESHRRDVIIPAFICPSVPRAVVAAGLNVILCDVRPDNFGIDPGALEEHITSQALAVVATHLFGYPNDLSAIADMAARNGVFVVEDAAQAFGARWNSQPVGTLNSVGIFSFGMSKVLSTMGGGLISVNDERLIESFTPFFDVLQRPGRGSQFVDLIKIALLSMLSHSRHLGPLMYIWEKYFRGSGDLDDFDQKRYTPAQAAIASRLIDRFTDIISPRRNNALLLEQGLEGLPGIKIPQKAPESSPVYLRFPVVVEDVAVKEKLLKKLTQGGINVSQMYDRRSFEAVRSLSSFSGRYPITEYLCNRMVSLPTHAYLTEREISVMVDAFQTILT